MTPTDIQAIGNFLATYHSDLTYIRNFQKYKSRKEQVVSFDSLVPQDRGTFYRFLIEFRVARNFESKKSDSILQHTMNWVNNSHSEIDNVDGFAESLRQFTHEGKKMTSLASKILFLNNPWRILPIDGLARKAVKQKNNSFMDYSENLKAFKNEESESIQKNMEILKPFAAIIEKEFMEDIASIAKIRENRFIDKILWTRGKNSAFQLAD